MKGATSCGDRVLVAYAVTAILPDGTVDVAILHEPQAGKEGPRALAKFMGFRALYVHLGAAVSFTAIWLPRVDAIAHGVPVMTAAQATAKGELARARARGQELAAILGALGDSARDALDSADPEVVSVRLSTVVLSGVVLLNELGAIAGRVAAIGAVRRDL